MRKSGKNFRNNGNEIRIPLDFIEKIDKIVGTGKSIYTSREEFVKSAVEIKLASLGGGSGSGYTSPKNPIM